MPWQLVLLAYTNIVAVSERELGLHDAVQLHLGYAVGHARLAPASAHILPFAQLNWKALCAFTRSIKLNPCLAGPLQGCVFWLATIEWSVDFEFFCRLLDGFSTLGVSRKLCKGVLAVSSRLLVTGSRGVVLTGF